MRKESSSKQMVYKNFHKLDVPAQIILNLFSDFNYRTIHRTQHSELAARTQHEPLSIPHPLGRLLLFHVQPHHQLGTAIHTAHEEQRTREKGRAKELKKRPLDGNYFGF